MQFLSCLGLRAAYRQGYDLPGSFNLNAHVAQAKNATIVAVGKLPTPGWGPHPAKRANPVGIPPGTPGFKARRRHPERRWRSGGADGNEILTSATAIVLVVLLVAEWITVVHMNGLIPTHMFIGLVLIPSVALKLGSTGYRMFNYYAGSGAYRKLGPPVLPLRLMAPLFVAATIALFASGVLLLGAGHKSHEALTIHKLAAIVFGVTLAVHVLAYIARVVRSLITDWRAARRQAVPGAGMRAMLVAAAIGGGAALALALLPTIQAYASR